MINLHQCLCEDNRRIEPEEIARLAASIGNIGLIQPIVLREIEPDSLGHYYEVMAGRRRWRALMLLERYELDDADYRVIDTDDPELVSFVENHERKNLSLFEEIDQLREMSGRYGAAELATLIGRTEKYIRLRLRLGDLIPSLRKAMETEKFPAMKLGHYEALSCYPTECQRNLPEFALSSPGSVACFQEKLTVWFRNLLATARFLDDDRAGCRNCPRRTGADPWLFEEFKRPEDDQCLDPACFSKKEERFFAAFPPDEPTPPVSSVPPDKLKSLNPEQYERAASGRRAAMRFAEYLEKSVPPRPDDETLLGVAGLLGVHADFGRAVPLEAWDTISPDELRDALWRGTLGEFRRHAAGAKRIDVAHYSAGFDATAARICGVDFDLFRDKEQ